jgi:hypothetical protein
MLPILKEAAQIPGLFKEIYGDLAKPGVTQVGKALGAILGLGNTILWPVYLVNEKARVALESNLEKYRRKMETVPEEEVVEVPPDIGIPITDKMGYVTNEELSDMYVELLVKASSYKTANLAHPSFTNVIDNLSPDEAIIFKEIAPAIKIPILSGRLLIKGKSEWKDIHPTLLTGLEIIKGLSFPKNIVAYVSNFEGLGLLEVLREVFIVNDALYEKLESIYRPGHEKMEYDKEKYELHYLRGQVRLTPYGQMFYEAAIK